MMRFVKSVFCVLLSLLLVGCILPYSAAAEVYTEEFYWDKAGEDADNGYKAFSVEFGAPLILPDDPEREGSTFLGWKDWYTDAFVDLTKETMNAKGRRFYAVWQVKTYPSYFYVFGELLCTVDNVPGEAFVQPRRPEREGYTFAGWSPKPPAVAPAEALTFNAVFTPNAYIATLLVDGAVYQEIEYTYGQKSIELPDVPKKDGYTGAWEPYTLPVGGVTIRAIYTPITYIATLVVDGKVYQEIEYVYGQKSIDLPDVPKKDGCTGAWEPYSLVIGGVTIHAIYTPITYIATLLVDGVVYKEIGYVYGQKSIVLPDVPEKDGFTGEWEPYSLVIGGVTIHAIYTPKTYVATLIVDGKVYKEIEYVYGQKSIELPEVPKKEGYTGAWAPYTLPVGGVRIRAIYTPVDRTAKTIAGDADGDGMISLVDAAVIQRSLAGGWDTEDVCPANMDVNGDGLTDLKDVVLVRRYLAGGWDVELV